MAADYINRTALTEQLSTLAIRYAAMGFEKVAQNYNWAVSVLDGAPAADVAEVVRCRDCAKHYVVLGRDMCAKNASGSGDHLIGLSATLPDAFCSRGVRKDGGENDVSG